MKVGETHAAFALQGLFGPKCLSENNRKYVHCKLFI